MDHLETGKIGEKLATDFLKKKGYKIIQQNYKTKYAEIDLVARQKETLVFVEVRTKTNEAFGSPEETLNYQKLNKVLQNSRAYAAFTNWQGPCRIDAICVILGEDNKPQRIDHYENIV
jgi:putative endonuclease